MHSIDPQTCHSASFLKYLLIAQDKALHDTTRIRRWCFQLYLPMFSQKCIDGDRHIVRCQKAWIIRIDQGAEWWHALDILQQRFIFYAMTSSRPDSLAFLQQPEPHHIFEEARRAKDTSLVGEIRSQ